MKGRATVSSLSSVEERSLHTEHFFPAKRTASFGRWADTGSMSQNQQSYPIICDVLRCPGVNNNLLLICMQFYCRNTQLFFYFIWPSFWGITLLTIPCYMVQLLALMARVSRKIYFCLLIAVLYLTSCRLELGSPATFWIYCSSISLELTASNVSYQLLLS